jgi:hypothetical protein
MNGKKSPPARDHLLVLACACLALWSASGIARADGRLGDEDGMVEEIASPRRERGVIEVWPSLDHHYRNDMVEPGWRLYQDPSGRHWQDEDWRRRDEAGQMPRRNPRAHPDRNRHGGDWREPPRVIPGVGPRSPERW